LGLHAARRLSVKKFEAEVKDKAAAAPGELDLLYSKLFSGPKRGKAGITQTIPCGKRDYRIHFKSGKREIQRKGK